MQEKLHLHFPSCRVTNVINFVIISLKVLGEKTGTKMRDEYDIYLDVPNK